MFYELKLTKAFKKGYKLAEKRGLNTDLLDEIVEQLQNDITLDPKYRDHQLKGSLKDMRECHIEPNWLLVYKKDNGTLILTLVATGTHSDHFDM